MTTSWSELPRCDTELSLGRPAAPAPPSRCRGTDELMKQKQAAATPYSCGGGLTATELQAMAILHVARRAAAEDDEGDAAAGLGLSMRRSMEWFLQLRREARHQQHGGAAASPSSSSSSLSCLTDSSRI